VDDTGHVVDVEPAGGHIRGDECRDPPVREVAERTVPLALRAVAMDRGGSHAEAVELAGDAVRSPLCATEHDGGSCGRDHVGAELEPPSMGGVPEEVGGEGSFSGL
jgi:hypothetical protein